MPTRALSLSLINNMVREFNVIGVNRMSLFVVHVEAENVCNGPGEITPSYILHTCAFGTYLLGGCLPRKKNYKVMVFYM
jgi:hypothetical protein